VFKSLGQHMIKTFFNSCLDGIEKQLDQLLHLKEDVWYPFSQTEINQSNLAATKKQEADSLFKQ
jgi:hypothetical protein